MYLAPIEYDFCMILNCIFCIIYCCIYYVCNNLVALLKFVQYVRIKKYLFIIIRNASFTFCLSIAFGNNAFQFNKYPSFSTLAFSMWYNSMRLENDACNSVVPPFVALKDCLEIQV